MDLLSGDEGEQNNFDTLNVNEAFKARFEHNERRKHLERGKNMFGENLEDVQDHSSSSDDDSDAELLNPNVDIKILQVLNAIKNNDPKLKEEKPLFNDEDFEEGKGKSKGKTKAFTLKDQIRTHTLKKMDKEGSSSSDSDDEDNSDNEGDVKKKRRAKESNLFTKIGVP